MTGYLIHMTLTTGHAARHYRADTPDAAVQAVSGVLDGALLGGRVAVPGYPDTWATAANAGRNLLATLHRGDVPILSTAVCIQSRSSRRLWRLMHDSAYALATDPDEPVSPPWVADRIEPGALDHMDAMRWTGSWARCLGWAWLEYDR